MKGGHMNDGMIGKPLSTKSLSKRKLEYLKLEIKML